MASEVVRSMGSNPSPVDTVAGSLRMGPDPHAFYAFDADDAGQLLTFSCALLLAYQHMLRAASLLDKHGLPLHYKENAQLLGAGKGCLVLDFFCDVLHQVQRCQVPGVEQRAATLLGPPEGVLPPSAGPSSFCSRSALRCLRCAAKPTSSCMATFVKRQAALRWTSWWPV